MMTVAAAAHLHRLSIGGIGVGVGDGGLRMHCFLSFQCCHLHLNSTTHEHGHKLRLKAAAAAAAAARRRRRSVVGQVAGQDEGQVEGEGEGEGVGVALVVGRVTEVDKHNFWATVEAAAAADKLVVLDMYTQWCGPCKLIAPKIEQLSTQYTDVVFLKLDCNQDNKPLAKQLGVKVVPTFKLLRGTKIIKDVTGAKFNDLVNAIESLRSSSQS